MATKKLLPSLAPKKPSLTGAKPMNPMETARRANGIVGMKKGGKVCASGKK
jgi:hypothetical protein